MSNIINRIISFALEDTEGEVPSIRTPNLGWLYQNNICYT